jgi:hypothetical protein
MATFLGTIKAKGLGGTWRAIADRVIEGALEPYWERRLDISTRGTIAREALGYSHRAYSHYAPTAYGNILRMLRALDVRAEPPEVLVDLGAGKGRVLVMAARVPFARIVGVERSADLAAAARRNVDRARRRGASQPVEVVTADAATYEIPDDATVVYFASPFSGHVLEAVLDNVHASLVRAPRPLRIVSHGYDAANPFERQIRRREWLELRDEIRLLRSNCGWIYENSRWKGPRDGAER